MKRLCVFAHYDRDNIIDDYVVYYLTALREVCSNIIFVSDSDVGDTKIIDDIVDYKIIGRHGEYDFGSYKRGFLFAKENKLEFDELLFINDSCYGPFYPLKPIFEKMESKKCDFWGMSFNRYGIAKHGDKYIRKVSKHVQSYFLAFNPKVFNCDYFLNFMNSIKQEENKGDVIIKYEMGLTELLENNNCSYKTFINEYSHTENCLSIKWDKLIKYKNFPFIKTSVARQGVFVEGTVAWENVISRHTDYPCDLIKNNSGRLNLQTEENLYKKMNVYRKMRYKILKNLPMEFREITIIIEKSCYKLLNTLFLNKLKKF